MHDARVVLLPPVSRARVGEDHGGQMRLCRKDRCGLYVRKRIPRAWKGRVEGEVVRLSLRTKDRALALKWGLEALAVLHGAGGGCPLST